MPRTRFPNLADASFNHILVMCLAGFGDTIMATPFFTALRQNYARATITALAMWNTTASLLKHLDVFNQVVHHNFLRGSLLKSMLKVWRLRREHFDLGILVYPANRVHYNVLARLIGPRCRLGHDYQCGNAIAYGRFLLTHRARQTPATHNVLENLKLAKLLGIPQADPVLTVGDLGRDHMPWAREFLSRRPPPYIGIHPGCSPLKNHLRRRWPAEKFGKLAAELSERAKGACLVFLGPDEQDLTETILSAAPGAAIVSSRPIEQVAAIIRQCDLFVCCDSSLGHLAAACNVSVVTIVGPTNPEYTHPWSIPHRVVSRNLPCSPCFQVSRRPLQCRQGLNFACIRDISVSSVIDACESLLKAQQDSPMPQPARAPFRPIRAAPAPSAFQRLRTRLSDS